MVLGPHGHLYHTFTSFFTDLILCTFEENFCDWAIQNDDDKYKWIRKNENQLNNNNIPGPVNGDYHNEKDKFFLIASDHVAGQEVPPGSKTILKSPDFMVADHPIECFNFWFYFGVSIVIRF